MGQGPYRSGNVVDEDDTGEVPRDVLRAVLARIRAEEALRQRALRAMQVEAQVETHDLDASLDSAPMAGRRLWSPASFFAGLGVAASVPAVIIWWMLA